MANNTHSRPVANNTYSIIDSPARGEDIFFYFPKDGNQVTVQARFPSAVVLAAAAAAAIVGGCGAAAAAAAAAALPLKVVVVVVVVVLLLLLLLPL